MTALKQTCQLPASLPTEEFLSRALEMSDDELERMQEDLKRFQIDKPFHLFSGATWPAVLLWELLNNRRAFSSASDVRERLRNVHYFDLADSVDLEEFAISLLIGLKPLLNSERVGELMLDLTDDSLIAFKDTLPPGSVLLNDRERLKAHAPSYDPNWCKAAWGYQADLIKTAKASVSLHQQYLEFPDKSTAWRVFLEFSGAYKTAQQGIVERAANENIGELGYLDDGVFEISKEITPNWVEWDKQRSNLAQQARRAYDFVASLPIPPRSQL
jgi:hypothetical protein